MLLNSYYTLDVVLNVSAIKYNCHLLVKRCCEKNWHTYVQTVVKQQLKKEGKFQKLQFLHRPLGAVSKSNTCHVKVFSYEA